MNDIIIIGGGIGGSAAALRAAQNGMQAIWFLGSKFTRKRSRSQWVKNLDNIVGFHEGIIKDQIIKTLKKNKQEKAGELIRSQHYLINNRAIIKNTIERIKAEFDNVRIIELEVQSLAKNTSGFVINAIEDYTSKSVVLSMGVMDKQPQFGKLDKSGKWLESPQWIYPFANREQFLYCIRCEGHLARGEHVAVIGHSNIVAELSMMLHERYAVPATILTNGEIPRITDDRYKILKYYGIDVITEPIVDLMSEGAKQLHGFKFKTHAPLEVKFALVSLGLYRVYNDLARQMGARLMDQDQPEEKRHVWIDHKGETSIRNLFAVGDMVKRDDEPVMKQVYTAQEYAVRAVDTIDSRRRKAMRDRILKG